MFKLGTKVLFVEVNSNNDSGPKAGQTAFISTINDPASFPDSNILVYKLCVLLVKKDKVERTNLLGVFPCSEELIKDKILKNISESNISYIRSTLGSNDSMVVIRPDNGNTNLLKLEPLEFEAWFNSIITNNGFNKFLGTFRKKNFISKLDSSYKINETVFDGFIKVSKENDLRKEVINNLTDKSKQRLIHITKLMLGLYTYTTSKPDFKLYDYFISNQMDFGVAAKILFKHIYNNNFLNSLKGKLEEYGITNKPIKTKLSYIHSIEKIKTGIHNKA